MNIKLLSERIWGISVDVLGDELTAHTEAWNWLAHNEIVPHVPVIGGAALVVGRANRGE